MATQECIISAYTVLYDLGISWTRLCSMFKFSGLDYQLFSIS